MYNLIRFYNQNRKTIFKVILIVASIIGLIQLVNYFVGHKDIDEDIINDNENMYNSNEIPSFTSSKSAISGETVSSKQLVAANNIIDNFINYCNKGEIEKAYDLLTQDCKEEVFSTLEQFRDTYYNNNFNGGNKSYSIQNWIGNTYQVNITEDLLATGKVNDAPKQDYITIVEENDENKLNINNYIGKTEINKTTDINDLKITVISKNSYMDYEIYNLKIENNTNKDILLDDKQSTKNIYLEDTKGTKSVAYGYEILDDDLLVRQKYNKNISIKFTNKYNSSRKIKYLVFSKVILDYNAFQIVENKDQYNTYKFQVNV